MLIDVHVSKQCGRRSKVIHTTNDIWSVVNTVYDECSYEC